MGLSGRITKEVNKKGYAKKGKAGPESPARCGLAKDRLIQIT